MRAAALIASEVPAARFAVIGGQIFGQGCGHFESELRALTDRLGIAGKVLFVGHQDQMAEIYGCLDLVLHTSEREPFGRVLIEAMAAARPVVAFASGAAPEIVEDGETGFLVRFGAVEDMAKRAVTLLSEPARAVQMGLRGRQSAEQRFDVRKKTREVCEVYVELMGEED